THRAEHPPSVVELRGLEHTRDGADRRAHVVASDLAPAFDEHHAELGLTLGREAVLRERAVPRFEDVQRQEQAREQHRPQREHRHLAHCFGPSDDTSTLSGYCTRITASASSKETSAVVTFWGSGTLIIIVKLSCAP